MNYLLNNEVEVIMIFLKLIDELSFFIFNNLLLNIFRINKYFWRFADVIKIIRIQIEILIHKILMWVIKRLE